MTLWDSDKDSDRRTNPALNQNDRVQQRLNSATNSINPVTDDSAIINYPGFLRLLNVETITLNYTASTGSIATGGGSYTSKSSTTTGTPLTILSYFTNASGKTGTSAQLLPYIEINSSGAIQLMITVQMSYNNINGYTASTVTALVPTGSTYYASNHTWYVKNYILDAVIGL